MLVPRKIKSKDRKILVKATQKSKVTEESQI